MIPSFRRGTHTPIGNDAQAKEVPRCHRARHASQVLKLIGSLLAHCAKTTSIVGLLVTAAVILTGAAAGIFVSKRCGATVDTFVRERAGCCFQTRAVPTPVWEDIEAQRGRDDGHCSAWARRQR
jgi:hypothetical protein